MTRSNAPRFIHPLKVLCTCITFVAASMVSPAAAGERCAHAVVFTLPGVTWSDVERERPPHLLEAARRGAVGSISVRTNSSVTSYASGFATIGAGARLDGGVTTGSALDRGEPAGALSAPALRRDVRVAGIEEVRALASAAGYGAAVGALADSLGPRVVAAIGNGDNGRPPPVPAGFDRWPLLAAMDDEGIVDLAATGPEMLERSPGAPFEVVMNPSSMRAALARALGPRCSTIIVGHGDLIRADTAALTAKDALPSERVAALRAADDLLGWTMAALSERDLLLIVSPTSPAWEPEQHLGVAVAVGPRFRAGAVLSSASTRRSGIVTLPDVAPTVLEHQRLEVPAAMTGAPFFGEPSSGDRIAAAVALDEESVLVEGAKSPVSTGYVLVQLAVYLSALAMIWRRKRLGAVAGVLGLIALSIAAFPVATFLVGLVDARVVGILVHVALACAVAVAVAGLATLALGSPGARLLVIASLTIAVMLVDVTTGAVLQINTLFGYSPIIAGRFAGVGNIAFAVMAGSCVVGAALLVEEWDRRRAALACAAGLFVLTTVVDGAPQFGSDIGGVLALVPGLAVTWVWLSERRVNWKLWIAGALGALAVLGLFLAFDLSRPPETRTHLASLFNDVREQGFDYLVTTIVRKARSNLRVLTSTIWTLLVPAGLALLFVVVYRRQGLGARSPKLAAAIGGGLIVAALGFATNDSGIVIPAVMLSFLVPLALVMRLSLETRAAP